MLPANKTDFATLLHDIKYLQTAGEPSNQWHWDKQAIRDSSLDLPGIATTIGLTTRKVLGLTFNKPLKNYTSQQTQQLGNRALLYVKTHQPYKSLFRKYDIDPDSY